MVTAMELNTTGSVDSRGDHNQHSPTWLLLLLLLLAPSTCCLPAGTPLLPLLLLLRLLAIRILPFFVCRKPSTKPCSAVGLLLLLLLHAAAECWEPVEPVSPWCSVINHGQTLTQHL